MININSPTYYKQNILKQIYYINIKKALKANRVQDDVGQAREVPKHQQEGKGKNKINSFGCSCSNRK